MEEFNKSILNGEKVSKQCIDTLGNIKPKKYKIKVVYGEIYYNNQTLKDGIIILMEPLKNDDYMKEIEVFLNNDEYYICNVIYYEWNGESYKHSDMLETEMYKCDTIGGLVEFINEVSGWI